MLAFTFNTGPDSGGGGGFNPVLVITEAAIVVVPCCIGAVVFRKIFIWGNHGRTTKPKKERKAAALTKVGQKVTSKKTKKRGITGKRIRGICQYWTAWVIVFGIYLTCLLMMIMIMATKFTPENTNGFMLSWGVAMATAWLIMEPLEVVALVFFPQIFENKYIAQARTIYKDYFL